MPSKRTKGYEMFRCSSDFYYFFLFWQLLVQFSTVVVQALAPHLLHKLYWLINDGDDLSFVMLL